jgi:hypothetical protein
MQHTQSSRKSRRTFWKTHLSRFKQSGLTQKTYCERAHINSTTFSWWKKRLSTDPEVSGGFARIPSAAGFQSAPFEMIVGGIFKVYVPQTHDSAALESLLKSVRAVC